MPTTTCTKFVAVQDGDTCDSIDSAEKITLNQLMKLNPSINDKCDNLAIGEAICVKGA